MKKTNLAKSIAMVLAGTAMTAGAVSTASAAGTVWYNNGAQTRVTGTYSPVTSTDGFVWGGVGWRSTNATPPVHTGWVNPNWTGTRPNNSNGDPLPVGSANFTGLAPGATPFDYIGSSHMNWAVSLRAVGDTAVVSKANAVATYGAGNTTNVEVDTGAGAWQDNAVPIQGWRHQVDIGLIKSEVGAYILLTPSVVAGTGFDIQNFGITVFTGMDSNTGTYSHHGSWNCPTCTIPRNYTDSDPFGTQGLTYLTHSATVDANNPLTFWAEAGQVYSIYIGGAGVGRWNQNIADYQLNVAAVPVPAAVWFFGTALAGLMGFNRRNKAAA